MPLIPPLPHPEYRSPHLLENTDISIVTVTQLEVPIQRRQPRPSAFGPLDQHDGPVAHHVLEAEILRFGWGTEAVAIDVINEPGVRCRVLVDQRVGGTRGGSPRPPPPTNRPDGGGFPPPAPAGGPAPGRA